MLRVKDHRSNDNNTHSPREFECLIAQSSLLLMFLYHLQLCEYSALTNTKPQVEADWQPHIESSTCHSIDITLKPSIKWIMTPQVKSMIVYEWKLCRLSVNDQNLPDEDGFHSENLVSIIDYFHQTNVPICHQFFTLSLDEFCSLTFCIFSNFLRYGIYLDPVCSLLCLMCIKK